MPSLTNSLLIGIAVLVGGNLFYDWIKSRASTYNIDSLHLKPCAFHEGLLTGLENWKREIERRMTVIEDKQHEIEKGVTNSLSKIMSTLGDIKTELADLKARFDERSRQRDKDLDKLRNGNRRIV
jgi:hypothetical protein